MNINKYTKNTKLSENNKKNREKYGQDVIVIL